MGRYLKKATLYCGTDTNKYKVYSTDEINFSVGNRTNYGSIEDDEYANDYILSSSLSITRSGNNIVASFTPCTDTDLLARVSGGKTKVRIQLLHYTVSGHTMHGRSLPPGTYWTNSSSRYRDKYSYWTRCMSNEADYNGVTWVDLTEDQLRAGTYTFVGAYSCVESLHTECNMWPIEEDEGAIPRLSAEMFCPALHRYAMDIFYYEREYDYYCVSDNCIEI